MPRPRFRFTVRGLMAAVAFAALILAILATSYKRHQARQSELSAWFFVKAAEARALADEQERNGSLIGAKRLRDAADWCEERARSARSSW